MTNKRHLCKICRKKLRGKKTTYCTKKCKAEGHKLSMKKYYGNNKDKFIESARKWKEANPELFRYCRNRSVRRFRKKHPERILMSVRKSRKAHENEFRVRAYTNKCRKEILAILGTVCSSCGSKENIEIHHLRYYCHFSSPKKKGIEKLCLFDLEILCESCHKEKHRK